MSWGKTNISDNINYMTKSNIACEISICPEAQGQWGKVERIGSILLKQLKYKKKSCTYNWVT